jgi:uncharacterized membrane protein (DUF485 family)
LVAMASLSPPFADLVRRNNALATVSRSAMLILY